LLANHVIHVVAEEPRKGENTMISILEATETAPAAAAAPKATKKARVGKQRTHVAPAKGKATKKASPRKKAPKGAKKATGARDGSKPATILDLLKRKDGATLKKLMKATDWQVHSVRGGFALFPFKPSDSTINDKIDVAKCKPTEDLKASQDARGNRMIRPVKIEYSNQPDGTQVAFTGFPLNAEIR